MQLRKIPVACVQPRAHDRAAFDTAWARIVQLVRDAGRGGARLIVLPEATVPGYVLGSEPVPAEQLARAAFDLGEVAAAYGATIVYGSAKRIDGRTFNAAVVIGPDGRELGYAAKQFLWHFDRRWFAAGATLDPIDTPLGRLGVLICADGRIPTIAATLRERGAELLVMPTAWVTSGRDPSALENVQADLMVNVRAKENGVPFVAANKAGVEVSSVAYCGKSAIVAADGTFVARGSERDEALVVGDVEVGAPRSPERTALGSPPGNRGPSPARARIAFTLADDPADVARFAALASDADADVLLARALPRPSTPGTPVSAFHESQPDGIYEAGGIAVGIAGDDTLRSPRGLTQARLGGCDLFVWHAAGEPAWHVPFARTRAAELRAYVVVFAPGGVRAVAVDPDGVVVAGTFGDYRLASFVYDRSRSTATLVAPHTDVFAGLQVAETIRTRGAAEAVPG